MSDTITEQSVDGLIAVQFENIDRCITIQRAIYRLLLQQEDEATQEAAIVLTRMREARHWLEECER